MKVGVFYWFILGYKRNVFSGLSDFMLGMQFLDFCYNSELAEIQFRASYKLLMYGYISLIFNSFLYVLLRLVILELKFFQRL